MGITLTVFSLYALENADAGCLHHLLLRVEQPEFSNADAAGYDRAFEVAEEKRRALIRAYQAGALASIRAAPHEARLVGELQSHPPGDELADAPRGREVDVWVAETRYGHPWVVMGTAADEDSFWRQVEANDDLTGLGPIRPALLRRAWFVAEEETRQP
ncbi:MAG TPA: hypothetical protein VF771_20610 [Longimicrobiaceae bacterium]